MKVERGCNKVEPGIGLQQRAPREVPASGKFLAPDVPIDANPVIERLQGQVNVLTGLQFKDGQTAAALGGKQVDQVAVSGGEGGHLAVDRVDESGVDQFDVLPHLVFETALGAGMLTRLGFGPRSFEGAQEVAVV